jgi:hypothetical protein
MEVVCVNNDKDGLTLGKIYQVEEEKYYSKFFTVINDDGEKVQLFKGRFKTRIEITKERLKNL